MVHIRAQKIGGLFKTQILRNVWMVQVFQGFTLHLQRLHNRNLPCLTTCGCRDLDLFYSDHFSRSGVQGQVYTAVRAFPDQFTTNPLEDSLERKKSLAKLDFMRSMSHSYV
jgi:hypothetical protein